MSEVRSDGTLTAFWVRFPDDPGFPTGLGVTGWSESDVCRLLDDLGYDFHRRAKRVEFVAVRTVDEVGLSEVARHAGPLVVRGVWYPCWNIGLGAP